MKNLMLLASAALLLGGCAMRTKILDASAISMTQSHLPPGATLRETGTVTGKFCSDMMSDKGSIGLIDAAVKDAQQHNQVDWILNAGIWSDGSCTEVEGTGARVVARRALPAAPNERTHKAPPARKVRK
jgi:hypothetical protein